MSDQFNVHRNPGRTRSVVPFVVVVQSNRFSNAAHQVVVPMVAAEAFGLADSDVGPHFMIGDRKVVLAPLQITNVPSDVLGAPVAAERIMNALEVLLSRARR